MKEQEIKTTDKKSIKEIVMEHRGKIIAGASIISTGALSVLLYKTNVTNKVINERVFVLEAAVSEGVLEEAIATTTRKLNSRKDRLEYLLNSSNIENVKEIISKLEMEIGVLTKRRDAFTKAQKLMGIDD